MKAGTMFLTSLIIVSLFGPSFTSPSAIKRKKGRLTRSYKSPKKSIYRRSLPKKKRKPAPKPTVLKKKRIKKKVVTKSKCDFKCREWNSLKRMWIKDILSNDPGGLRSRKRIYQKK